MNKLGPKAVPPKRQKGYSGYSSSTCSNSRQVDWYYSMTFLRSSCKLKLFLFLTIQSNNVNSDLKCEIQPEQSVTSNFLKMFQKNRKSLVTLCSAYISHFRSEFTLLDWTVRNKSNFNLQENSWGRAYNTNQLTDSSHQSFCQVVLLQQEEHH